MQKNEVPKNTQAEEAVISGCLYSSNSDCNAIDNINPQLEPSDFFSEKYSILFDIMLQLNQQNIMIDKITVGEELRKQPDKLNKIGGVAGLIFPEFTSPYDVEYYANIVRDLSVSRRLMVASESIKKIAGNGDNVSDKLNKADRILLDIRKHGVPSPIVTPEDRALRLAVRYENLYTSPKKVSLPTGFRDLDIVIGGGFYKGDIVILAARTSMGKTSLLQTIANHIGKNNNVLFCSAEMSSDDLSDRDVAGIIKKPTYFVRMGNYDDATYQLITGKAVSEIGDRRVYIYEDSPLTTDRILQAGLNMQLRYGLDFVVVDYLGLLDDDYGRSTYERISYISRKIKQIAMKLKVPILIAHQLNRDVENRNDKRPMLSDLRDSGRIEEDADIVLFLYRDNYYNINSDNNITELIVAKNRQGSTGKVSLYFDEKSQLYAGVRNE